MYLVLVPFLLGLLAVGLGGTYGWKYWRICLCVLLLSLALPKQQSLLTGRGAAGWTLIYAFPISAAFAAGNTVVLRARPLLRMLVVALTCASAFVVGLILGVNLGFIYL